MISAAEEPRGDRCLFRFFVVVFFCLKEKKKKKEKRAMSLNQQRREVGEAGRRRGGPSASGAAGAAIWRDSCTVMTQRQHLFSLLGTSPAPSAGGPAGLVQPLV